MYQSLYHLSKAPFQASIDPDYFWWGKNSEKILKDLRSDLEQHGRLTFVTGGPGSGKTTLMSMVLAELTPQVLAAMIADPRLTIAEFYDLTAHALVLPGRCKNRQQFHEKIQALVRKAGAQNKHVVLVIDEAQQLSPELIVELKKIIEFFSGTSDKLAVCLVGQLEETDGMQGPIIKAFRNHDLVLHHLEPLTPEETGKYIQHRLTVAGGQDKIFTDDAFVAIHQISGGYPGQINIICDVALFIGSIMQIGTIDAALIRSNAEKFQFTSLSHGVSGKTGAMASGRVVRTDNNTSDQKEHDDDAAVLDEKPHRVTATLVDKTCGHKHVIKRPKVRHVLGLVFMLLIMGGGYVYYISNTMGPAELPATRLIKEVDSETKLSTVQMTDLGYPANQQIPAISTPDQVDGSPGMTNGSSGRESPGEMREASDQQTARESANILEYAAGAETDRGVEHADNTSALLLPQLQEEIQAVLEETSEKLLLERKDVDLADTEERTAVYPGPLDALDNDVSRKGEAAFSITAERVQLKNFLAAGSFDIVTTPAPRETQSINNAERPEISSSAQEPVNAEVEPDPEHIIDWLLNERNARRRQ